MRSQSDELKRSQEMLNLQQQVSIASAKNAALGEMAGQAAHEINTPLGALILITQSLVDRVDKEPLDRAYFHQKLALILQITAKMSKIINSMRKMAGRGANEAITEVDVKVLVDETILLCEGRFKRASIIFNVEYPRLDYAAFECRADEISQILINLLNNAHDAVKSCNDLTRRWVKLTVTSEGDWVRFRVSDGGEGVRKEHRAKLFQTSFTTKSLAEGTGFGLPICKKIAEKHQGNIFLDEHAATTDFVLELPRRQVKPSDQAA
jgi:signal transduction histidine kinase